MVLAAEESIGAAPEEVFDLFGTDAGAGWLFDAECDLLTLGSVVTMNLPLGRGGRRETVQVLGRIAGLVPNRQIVVSHDQPWRGRLRMVFESAGPRATRVRLTAHVEDGGIEWLARRAGWPAPEPPSDGTHRIGLITSLSGPAAVSTIACDHLAEMAVNEINADGGILGRPVRLFVADDATDPQVGAMEARRLRRMGCRVLIASATSATFTGIQHAVGNTGIPLVHAVINEGGAGPGHVFRLGERPGDQVRAAAGRLMKETGGRNWFFIGDDYSWSHGAHHAARGVLAESGNDVVDEHYVPLGTRDFAPIIERIEKSGADLVLSTLAGADEVAFQRQSLAMGLRDRCRTLSLLLDESTRERMGDRAAAGLWTSLGYFQQLPSQRNKEFLAEYRRSFGRWAPPVSSMAESTYAAVHLYAAAVRAVRGDDSAQVVRELHRLRADLPRGEVELAGPHAFRQQLHLAEASPGGFKVLDPARSSGVIPRHNPSI
ncbi:substrate-binding protein [Amycolatopsis anabasis]|uniref:substrate-binding protein n=1 Tax=Amycolatopsis anabasis TaxID=1840409 RepID=UPI001FE986BE|nr:substrate-binding protein [Amycolatopsis anabasis]